MSEPMRPAPPVRPETDAYVDGAMEAPARLAYERVLASDAGAMADLERQRLVDAALADLFEPGPAPAIDVSAAERPLRPGGGWGGWRRWSAMAAAVVLVGIGVWAGVWMAGRGGAGGISAQRVYDSLVAKNFAPEEVCTDADKFEAYVKGRVGQGLRLGPDATGIRLVGWAYALDGKGGRVVVLMVMDREKPAIVFIDPANMDHPVAPPKEGGGLKMFERRAGRLVLREVTPHAEPGVAPHLEVTK
ncbi:MAG: hypothetical protein IT436_11970 [Phycisphaerales bacterium]|nr:hypothetical protein [Phycisphaerales bacterium]